MCPTEAREIASAFGILVAELNDTKRYTWNDFRKGLPFSLPADRLRHPKVQIQTALSVVIAELIAELAAHPTEKAKVFLNSTVASSGDLQYFSRKPLVNKGGDDSIYVYGGWVQTCQRCIEETAGELNQYWRLVDRLIPDLLNDPILATARET